ncbi:hypothetical protein LCGC14_1968680 [marine sediment metagenome]|uniref:Uncharacterized protein n=1 Tax=marine sediment metagenome TaxID=412755 RepID=A0A0F9G0M1_9ZZZZ
MIYVMSGIGILVVIAIVMFGLSELGKPMPIPKKGSYAEYLSDDERLGVQCNADYDLAKKLAIGRGWKEET